MSRGGPERRYRLQWSEWWSGWWVGVVVGGRGHYDGQSCSGHAHDEAEVVQTRARTPPKGRHATRNEVAGIDSAGESKEWLINQERIFVGREAGR